MITVRLAGGLGNQMFQFAAGLALSRRHGTELQLDAADLIQGTGCTFREYGLGIFRLTPHTRQDRRIGISSMLHDIIRVKIGRLYKEHSSRFDPVFGNIPKTAILEGYWQSPQYFEQISDLVRNAFTWKIPLSSTLETLVERIREFPTASIHFRRGDYTSNPSAASIHGGICTPAYYSAAIDRLRHEIPGIRFAVFSDEPDWVRANRPDLAKEIFVEGNTGLNAHLDMRIMSLCDHHIIANSTFSWWGAWLGWNPQRRVIAPRRWFADGREADIHPEKWELI